jgi:hypothetical protein
MSEENKVAVTVTADISNLTSSMREAGEATKVTTAAIQINSEKAQLILKKLSTEGSKDINVLIDSLRREKLPSNDMLGVVAALKSMGAATGELTSRNNGYVESLKRAVALQQQEVEFQTKIATARARVDTTQAANYRSSIQSRGESGLGTAEYATLNALLAQSAQEQELAAEGTMKAAAASKEETRAIKGEAEAHRLNSRALLAEAEAYVRANAEGGMYEGLSDRMKADAAIRAAQGNLTGVRAAGTFLTQIPGATAAISGLFNVIGAAAVVSIFVDIGTKVAEAIRKIKQMPQATAEAFGEMNSQSELTNAQLDLTNDKLRDRISILEHKPADGVARALDEARVRADQLAISLTADSKAMENLFKQNNIGFWAQTFTNKASTKQVQDRARGWNTQIDSASDDAANDLENARQAKDRGDKAGVSAYTKKASDDNSLLKVRLRQAIGIFEADEKQREKPVTGFVTTVTHNGVVRTPNKGMDQSENIQLDKGIIQQYRNRLANIEESDDNTALVGNLDNAENGVKSREEAKAAQQQRLTDMETQWADLQSQGDLGADSEYSFWSKRTDAFKKGSTEYLTVIRKENQAYALVRKSNEESLKSAAEVPGALAPNVQGLFGPAPVQTPAMPVPDAMKEDGSLEAIKQNSKAAIEFLNTLSSFSEQSQRQSTAMRQAQLDVAKATGSISAYQAAVAQAAIHNDDFAASADRLKSALAAVNANNAGLSIQQQAAARAKLQAQITDANNQQILQSVQDSQAIAATTFSGQLRTSLNEWVNDTQNAAKQVASVVTGTLDSVNGTFAEALTGKYRTSRERGDALKQGLSTDARGAASKLTNYGLQNLEGKALKGLGFGAKADGSQNNPFWVKLASKGITPQGGLLGGIGNSNSSKGSSGIGGLFSKLVGGGSGADSSSDDGDDGGSFGGDDTGSTGGFFSKAFGGVSHLFSGFQGFFADGGDVVANRPAIIGERGPEMFVPRGAGRIIPNDQAFSGGGGGNTHNWHIDARGSTDPAATHAAIMRAAPSIIAAANAQAKNTKMRRPGSASS